MMLLTRLAHGTRRVGSIGIRSFSLLGLTTAQSVKPAPTPVRLANFTRQYARSFSGTRYVATPVASAASGSRRFLLGGLAGAGIIAIAATGALISSQSIDGMGVASNVWPQYVRNRLTSTFTAFGVGVGVTAIAAVGLFRAGAASFLMTRPIVSMLLSLGGMIAISSVVHAIPHDQLFSKYMALFTFNTFVAFSICPVVALGGPLLLRAAAITGGIVGSLAIVAANAPSEKFLWMGGPLAMGLGAVLVSSIGSAFFPAVGLLHTISLYGGLAVFSGFVLYDTSRVVEHAKSSITYDPVSASISIYMDAVNIFIRIVTILASGNSNRRR